jgi:hypothetical protein
VALPTASQRHSVTKQLKGAMKPSFTSIDTAQVLNGAGRDGRLMGRGEMVGRWGEARGAADGTGREMRRRKKEGRSMGRGERGGGIRRRVSQRVAAKEWDESGCCRRLRRCFRCCFRRCFRFCFRRWRKRQLTPPNPTLLRRHHCHRHRLPEGDGKRVGGGGS